MMSAAEFEWYGRPAWIALTILGFILWWPVGLALLVFGCAARKMARRAMYGGWPGAMPGQWHNMMHDRCGWGGRGRSRWGGGAPSGNQAFDDYRAETLRRLEEEQREFLEYLERLRRAKDKSEFDQFMADRRRGRPSGGPPGETV
jgi:Protein of unknown function (DUF2852)